LEHKIIRLPAVKAGTQLSRSSIYEGVRKGTFPAPIKLGPRSVGWLQSEVEAWVVGRVAASRKETVQ
jgi:prophage regulatory protein